MPEATFDMNTAADAVGSGLGLDDGDSTDAGDDLGSTLSDISGDDDSGGAPASTATDQETETSAEGAETDTATTPAPDAAPKTWRKEAAATWTTLPPEVKAEVLKREEDMFRGLEGYKADAGFGKSVKSIMDPYMPLMRQHGIDPVGQLQNLMNAHYTLATGSPEQKGKLFAQLANDYQITLPQGQSEDPPYIDPAVAALQTELQGVKSQLSNVEAQRLTTAKADANAQIEKFASDPANTHFDAVASDMAALLEKGICKTLPEAYERAIWSNPAVRALEISRQQAESVKKTAAEAASRAEAAKKATAANVRTSAKSGSAAAPLGSIDDTLAETLAAIKSRA